MSMKCGCLGFFLMLMAALPVMSQSSPCVCSGFNADRAQDWSIINGPVFSRAVANLTDPSFFGSSGVATRSVTIGPGMQRANEATLSGIDIFWTGYTSSDSYTAAERTALLNAVLAGMSVVVSCDDSSHCLADLFGVSFADNGGETNTPAVADHPVFAGPFGRITNFRSWGNIGRFTAWPNSARVLATNALGASMLLIPKGALSGTAGSVLLTTDTDMFTTYGRQLSRNDSDPSVPVTDALVMNAVAFLCNPTAAATAPHLVFPQFANGQNNVSSMNVTSADNDNALSATFKFRDDAGAPFRVNIVGAGVASTFSAGNIPINQTVTLSTDGTGSLVTGWGSVTGSSPTIGGNIIFYAPGLGATAVPASPVAGAFVLPVVQQPTGASPINVNTGLAICNMTGKTAEIRLELWAYGVGRRVDGIQFLTLPAYGHKAAFLYQIYPSSVIAGFSGTLRVVSTNALISVTALQLGSSPGQFTAVPVTPQYR
jgi:hypothetical protein